jgi:hypothetical protein
MHKPKMDRFLCDYLKESFKQGSFDNLFNSNKKKPVKKRGMFYFITSASKFNYIQKERIKHYDKMLNDYKLRKEKKINNYLPK